MYGSVLGADTFVLHQISMPVNLILVNIGLSKEMQNPASLSFVEYYSLLAIIDSR